MISAVVGSVFLFILIGSITDNLIISAAIGLLFFLLVVSIMFSQSKLRVEIDNETVSFITKKKSSTYTISECGFHSQITNHDDYELTVDCNGAKESFDCSFLSKKDYMSLLNDLGIVGEKQVAIKLNTTKKI